ncbi:unnamed protein product [Heterobilharzia americana]|nr:unnamed protein product [Heterobilharzia americana]
MLGTRRRCWIDPDVRFLHAYHTLFSNLGPLQTVVIIFLDSVFIFKIRKYLQRRVVTKLSNLERRNLRNSILLLTSSISFIVISFPQAAFHIINRMGSIQLIHLDTYIFYHLGNFLWYLNSVRELIDFFIYLKCFKQINFNSTRLSHRFHSFSTFLISSSHYPDKKLSSSVE